MVKKSFATPTSIAVEASCGRSEHRVLPEEDDEVGGAVKKAKANRYRQASPWPARRLLDQPSGRYAVAL